MAWLLWGGAAAADGCDGFLAEAFFRNQPNAAILDCADRAGLDARAEDGATALHLAASFGGAALVRALLLADADPALLDRAGLTPLDAAAERSTDAAVIVSLLAWGAALEPEGSFFARDRATTALMRAARRPDAVDVVAALLAAGADPRWSDADGDTALHLALRDPAGGETARLLLRHAAAADAANDEGTTPLHVVAAYASDPDLVDLLVDGGGSADAAGPEGVTPLMLAASYATEPDLLDAFLDATEEPCALDDANRTARVLAEANGALRDSEPYWRLNQLCPTAP